MYAKRAVSLLSRTSYRTKLLVFILIGFSLFLLSVWITNTDIKDILTNLTVTFTAVAFIQITWDFLGGDIIESKLADIANSVDGIRTGIDFLTDANKENIGVIRVWSDRHRWQNDHHDGISVWKSRYIPNSGLIQIQSNTFWNNWVEDYRFAKDLIDCLKKRNVNLQIILLDPKGHGLTLRAKDEEESKDDCFREEHMRLEIFSTLSRLVELLQTISKEDRKKIEIRLSSEYVFFSQIIRTDNRMIVSTYLSGKSGSLFPTMQIQEIDTNWFKLYLEQFEINRSRSRLVSYDELRIMVSPASK